MNEFDPNRDAVLTNPWNESRQKPEQVTPDGLDLTEWNTFRIYWYPDKARIEWTWVIDPATNAEILLRAETDPYYVPDEPMSLYFNFWAPTSDWEKAFDPLFDPVDDSKLNEISAYEIDYVEVRVPEPQTLVCLVVGAAWLLRRRGNGRQKWNMHKPFAERQHSTGGCAPSRGASSFRIPLFVFLVAQIDLPSAKCQVPPLDVLGKDAAEVGRMYSCPGRELWEVGDVLLPPAVKAISFEPGGASYVAIAGVDNDNRVRYLRLRPRSQEALRRDLKRVLAEHGYTMYPADELAELFPVASRTIGAPILGQVLERREIPLSPTFTGIFEKRRVEGFEDVGYREYTARRIAHTTDSTAYAFYDELWDNADRPIDIMGDVTIATADLFWQWTVDELLRQLEAKRIGYFGAAAGLGYEERVRSGALGTGAYPRLRLAFGLAARSPFAEDRLVRQTAGVLLNASEVEKAAVHAHEPGEAPRSTLAIMEENRQSVASSLVPLLADQNEHVANRAQAILVESRDPHAIPHLVAILRKGQGLQRAKDVLLSMDKQSAVDGLLPLLASTKTAPGALELLKEITGEDFGRNLPRWRKWAREYRPAKDEG